MLETKVNKATGEVLKLAQTTEPVVSVSDAVAEVLMRGDLKSLTSEQQLQYHNAVCKSVGLNPLTQPFQFIDMKGKLVMYATRACAEQLRKINEITLVNMDVSMEDGVYIVRVTVKDKTGRQDISTGAAYVKNLVGQSKADKMMGAETKAKRRVTLSICGLGMLDETEVRDVMFPDSDAPVSTSKIGSGDSGGTSTESSGGGMAGNLKKLNQDCMVLIKMITDIDGAKVIGPIYEKSVPQCKGRPYGEYSVEDWQTLKAGLEKYIEEQEGKRPKAETKVEPVVEAEPLKPEVPDDGTPATTEDMAALNAAVRQYGMTRFMAAKEEVAKGVKQDQLTKMQISKILAAMIFEYEKDLATPGKTIELPHVSEDEAHRAMQENIVENPIEETLEDEVPF